MHNPLLTSLLLASMLAAPAPDKPQSDLKKAPDPYVERFKQLDRDHDGFVSLSEWPLEPASFKRVDRNQDGRLSAHELLTPNLMRDYREEQALRLDIDRDGRLGRPPLVKPQSRPISPLPSEWNPTANARDRQLFRNLDLNRDNRLSSRELTSAAEFNRADRNKDGVITPNEWPKR
jgi:Ca2+-binding EF-hand superfamily protein